MVKIKIAAVNLKKVPKKYVRLILTEEKSSHRFVETKNGTLEYHLGVGKWIDITPRKFIVLVRSIIEGIKRHQIENLALELESKNFPKLESLGREWFISTLAENLLLAVYEFRKYKTKSSKRKLLREILLCSKFSSTDKKAFNHGQTVANYTNLARDIANTTGEEMTPKNLGEEAKNMANGSKISVRVLDEKELKKEGLHALWAVGKGADDLPRFIIMEYFPLGKPGKSEKDKGKQPIVLIGKGITYDTGGLNIKPSGGMHEMHLDMSGGAAVISAIACAAKLGIKKNIVTLVPAAENAVSEKSMRAGDIINSHAGKTIEVLHTDAEGRLILADALSFSKAYNPRVIIDVATLTGASLIALGQQASALMTENSELQNLLIKLGEESGDYVWPLPLWDEYKSLLKSDRADVVNIHPSFSKFGGAIEGGAFLSYFAPKCPWAHIDMAPRMESIPSDKLAKGATGEPVRLLVRFLESY